MEKVRVTWSIQLWLGVCVEKMGYISVVTCSLGFKLSIWPSRPLFTVFISSLIYTLFGYGEGQGYTIHPVRIRCLCVEKMGYVTVGRRTNNIYPIWGMEKVRVTPSFQLGLGIWVWKKWGTSLLVICSLVFFLSIWPSRTLFKVFTKFL
jgi:hypothetical protein